MKRKYKILIIVFICSLLTYLIYFRNKLNKINFVAIGDGISSGETSFKIRGISFNDYIVEYFENHQLLKNYNNIYSGKNIKIDDLINKIENNEKDKNEIYNINQIIHKANLITICIGEEELVKSVITNDFNLDLLKEYINKYDKLLSNIKKNTDAKLIVLGFYENYYLNKSNIIILNSELSNLAKKYNFLFININELLLDKSYFVNNNSYYFNYKAHKNISEMIINSI